MILRIAELFMCLIVAVSSKATIDCDDGNYYIRADPKSEYHFYKCDNGKPVRFKCSDGLKYNPKTHVCDWPKNVEKAGKGAQKSDTDQQYDNNVTPDNNVNPDNNGGQTNRPGYTTNSDPGNNEHWDHQSYSSEDDDEGYYAIQIIDKRKVSKKS